MSVDTVLQLLDLIISDRTVSSSLHSVLADEELDPDDVRRLETQVEQVRGSLWRWRRREQELAAILSGVRELVELRDVDQLLERLVDRARGLLGADVAYLTEHYDDALKVRTTSGVVAPELRELFVPVGMGLASKIVRLRTPQWTSEYQTTHDVPHEEGIDDAVAAEGLVALLGVPLLAGNEVLGALFAANRATYEFSPEEIALLGAFADHAAVVLQTARLLETARSAAAEASDATRVLAGNLAAMERSTRVHEDLTAVVVSGGSAQEIAVTLSGALGRRVVILDRELMPVADAPSSDDEAETSRWSGEPTNAVREAIDRSRGSGLCVTVDSPGDACDVTVAVVSDDALLGALLLGPGRVEFGAVERRTVERAAQIMALVTLKQDAIIDAENRVTDELISDVLNPRTPIGDALLTRARSRGVPLDAVRSVVVFALPAEVRRTALATLRQLRDCAVAGEEDTFLVALSTAVDASEIAAAMRSELARHALGPVLAVTGPSVESVGELPAAFETARRCAGLLARLGRTDGVVDTREYAPYLAMFGEDTDPNGFVQSLLGPLLHWDEQHGGDLVGTLAAYLDSHTSPARTARHLHVHVNTVLQRLERITTLLGEGWRDPDPLFRLSVAVRLRKITDLDG